jgi:hypothetical protein
MKHPERAVAMHFIYPAQLIPVVEVCGGPQTAPEVVAWACAMLKAVGQTPALMNKEVDGFIINRLQFAVLREAWSMWANGVASAEAIDACFKLSLGRRYAVTGPIESAELGGLDIMHKFAEFLLPDLDTAKHPPATIANLVKRIDPKRRTPDLGPVPEPQGTDTVCFSIVDENGMAVSFINSVFASFGSGLASRKSGVVFHNRGQGFVLDPNHPNCIAPGKRPMHTLVPAMAMQDGKPFAAFGVMGAAFQPIGHVYMMTNMIDYGLDAQEAVDCPRMFFEGGEVLIEAGVPATTAAAMALMGHKIGLRADPWGGGQIVAFDSVNGTLVGGSDPRKDGLALGY